MDGIREIVCRHVSTMYEAKGGSHYMICCYRFDSGDGDGLVFGQKFTAKGSYLSKIKSSEIHLFGSWTTDKKRGGKIFSVSYCTEKLLNTEAGINALLYSGTIEGLGRTAAKMIIRKFGSGSFEALKDKDSLMQVIGISQKRAAKISESFSFLMSGRATASFLGGYGISQKISYQAFKSGYDIDLIRAHPYDLYKLGVRFELCDRIARDQRLPDSDPERIACGLCASLDETEKATGSTGVSLGSFQKKAEKLLEMNLDKAFLSYVRQMSEKKKAVVYQGYAYKYETYYAECDIAKDIARLSSSCVPIKNVKEKIAAWENEKGVSFDAIQEKAIETALTSGFCIITGGPGRGKTTVSQAICDIRVKYGKDKSLVLVSPTGKAAKRLSEASGYPASTIHSLLKLGRGESKSDEKISAEQVVIDECSMLDTVTAAALFSAIQTKGCVTMIGDPDQLPSVGCGAVLRDIIRSGCVPVVTLEKIYRQKDGGNIIDNAERIKKGDPHLAYDHQTFSIWQTDDFKTSAQYMLAIYKKKVAQYGVENVAVLCPYRHVAVEASADSMNLFIQNTINRNTGSARQVKIGTVFEKKNGQFIPHDEYVREGDLVMATVNSDSVANGDTGFVTSVRSDDSGSRVTVRFSDDNEVVFEGDEIRTLELAYAISIHKSQGSEYKCVIVNLLSGHGQMLKKNLLYTAVTRAKKEVHIVGSYKAIYKAIGTDDASKRHTLLTEKLQYAMKHRKSAAAEK